MPNKTGNIDIGTALKLPPKKAIAYFKKKANKLTWDWNEQLNMNNHLAFTVAKVARMDVLMDMRNMIDKSLKQGLTFKQFQKELIPKLQAKGWQPREIRDSKGRIVQQSAPHRLKTIYETNMQSAYSAGRGQSFMANKKNRPYLTYVAIVDGSTRASHLELNRQTHPVDSHFWGAYMPPNGYRCRCRVRALSSSQMLRRGGLTREAPRYKTGGKAGQIVRPDKGFSGNPATKNWEPNPGKYDKDIWKLGKTLPPPMPKQTKKPPFKIEEKKIGKTKKFYEAKTITEAEQWGKANGVAEKINYVGADLKIANDVNKTIWNLKKKYKSKLITITTGGTAPSHLASVTGGEHMNLNLKYFADSKYMDATMEQFQNSKWNIVAKPGLSGTQQLITHEFAHTIAPSYEIKKGHWQLKEWDEIYAIRRKYRKALKQYKYGYSTTKKGVKTFHEPNEKLFNETYSSSYADWKNLIGEFQAELFTQYEIGKIQNEFTKMMGELIKKNRGL